jgi:hypothetical protein
VYASFPPHDVNQADLSKTLELDHLREPSSTPWRHLSSPSHPRASPGPLMTHTPLLKRQKSWSLKPVEGLM